MLILSVGEKMVALIPVLVFAAFLTVIVVLFVRWILRTLGNRAKPVKTEWATVLSKREEVRKSMNDNIGEYLYAFSAFHVTFELENGKQLSFLLAPGDSARIAEGDRGKLTYQGSLFKDFVK